MNRNRLGASARGTARVPPLILGPIPPSSLEPGLDGQELMTEGGVVVWAFDTHDVRTVATSADLAALTGSAGDLVFVQSRKMYVRFAPAQALATSNTVFAGTGGQWNRVAAADPAWAYQAAWAFNATTGSDDNTGLDGAHALKTWDEFRNRMDASVQGLPFQQQTTCTLFTSLPEYLTLKQRMSESAAPNARLVIVADSTTITTVVTSNAAGITSVQAINRTAATPLALEIVDTSTGGLNYATNLGQRVRLTSGANIGAKAWIVKAVSATRARLGPFNALVDPQTFDGLGIVSVSPTAGDRYVIETVPSIQGHDIVIEKSSGSTSADRVAVVLASIQSGPGSAGSAISSQDRLDSVPSSSILAVYLDCTTISTSINGVQSSLCNHLFQTTGGLAVLCSAIIVSGGGALAANFVGASRKTGFPNPAIKDDFIQQGGTGLSISGPTVLGDVAFFDSTGDGLTVGGATNNAGGLCMAFVTGQLYGAGNTTVGVRVTGPGTWLSFDTRPNVIGTAGAFSLSGQIFANWTQAPLSDPFKLCGFVGRAVSGRASVYTTSIGAPVGATNIFTATPVKGLYIVSGYIAVMAAGAVGDTLTLTLATTDDSQAETIQVPLTNAAGTPLVTASVSAKGLLYFRVPIETDGTANVTFAIGFPTKTGAPVVSLRLSAIQEQSAGV